MAKGKTNQPLTFMIPSLWRELEMFQELLRQGHILVDMPPECLKVDIIFGTNCHVMTDEMMVQKGIAKVAEKAARKRKKNG